MLAPYSTENPVIDSVVATPGIVVATSSMRFITSSVRCSDVPSGSCAETMTYP